MGWWTSFLERWPGTQVRQNIHLVETTHAFSKELTTKETRTRQTIFKTIQDDGNNNNNGTLHQLLVPRN